MQVLHALVEAGEVGRAKECLKLYSLPESALQADVSDEALQEELRRCALHACATRACSMAYPCVECLLQPGCLVDGLLRRPASQVFWTTSRSTVTWSHQLQHHCVP